MNLVIGNTSQQSFYYPKDYVRISSRNIDFSFLKRNKFDSVYITFAEQRIYEKNVDYITPNFLYTIEIINSLLKNCNKIVVFTSCELWSNKTGVVRMDTDFNFNVKNEYTISKLLLNNKIKNLRNINPSYNKVVIIHPFNFNSAHRSKYFLFGKIFDSILNKKKINVGNLDFYRDMIHTKFLVKKAILAKNDTIIGSGKLFNVREFVIDLYKSFNLNYFDLVNENKIVPSEDKLLRADVDWEYCYQNLLNDTVEDLKEYYEKNKV
jgi:GDP-D-mannose dehydratase